MTYKTANAIADLGAMMDQVRQVVTGEILPCIPPNGVTVTMWRERYGVDAQKASHTLERAVEKGVAIKAKAYGSAKDGRLAVLNVYILHDASANRKAV